MTDELYGRAGAEIVAEKLGYPRCPHCGQRVGHLQGCPDSALSSWRKQRAQLKRDIKEDRKAGRIVARAP